MYLRTVSVFSCSEIIDPAYSSCIKTKRPRGFEKKKLMKALVDVMAKVQLAFCKHAQSMIESSYHLLPDIMDEINEVVYKHEAVRLLLLDDNYVLAQRFSTIPIIL